MLVYNLLLLIQFSKGCVVSTGDFDCSIKFQTNHSFLRPSISTKPLYAYGNQPVTVGGGLIKKITNFWKNVSENSWQILVNFWIILEILENYWKFLGNSGHFLQFFENSWRKRKIFGTSWKFLAKNGKLQKILQTHEIFLSIFRIFQEFSDNFFHFSRTF